MKGYRKFNINHYVKVRLTDIGIKELKRQHDELYEGGWIPPFEIVVDEDGYSKFQMHDLMLRFGHMLYCSLDVPFDTNIYIEYDE